MSLQSYDLHLLAWLPDGAVVPDAILLEALVGVDAVAPTAVTPSRARYQPMKVTFRSLAVSDLGGDEVGIERRLQVDLSAVGAWLSTQSHDAFQQAHEYGLRTSLLVDIWIDQDQFEVIFPSNLLASCGELGLSLHVITND